MEYERFIESKKIVAPEAGFEPPPLPGFLFPFQREMVSTAIRRGRAALFAECGLGKTPSQLAWSQAVVEHTGKPVLILAPLAVAKQTIREGDKFGIRVRYAVDSSELKAGEVVVSNYERLQAFDPSLFGGVVLDESSILKAYSGITKRRILEAFAQTPYRLACSATPAPNDHLELGNHSEFLSALSSHQMIARWFINDTSTFGTYRLKGHAVNPFWDWVSSWASMCALPSDIDPSFSDDGYVLPKLEFHSHVLPVDLMTDAEPGTLFRMPSLSATSVHKERRLTAEARAQRVAELVMGERNEPWIVWSETDYEADALHAALGDEAHEVRGSESLSRKEETLDRFTSGEIRVLITKPKIAGLGLNWQHCARQAFVAATFSFEMFYQAVRRSYRFGQARPVHVHMVMAETERGVLDVLNEKRRAFEEMRAAMMESARRRQHKRASTGVYSPKRAMCLPNWIKSEVAA